MFALFRGEVSGMMGQWREILTGWSLHVIAVTGVVSFAMTVLSMHATRFATPLTVSVLGALKQVLNVTLTRVLLLVQSVLMLVLKLVLNDGVGIGVAGVFVLFKLMLLLC